MRFLLFIFFSFQLITYPQIKTGTISGHVTNKLTGEPLPDCNIFIQETSTGTVSGKNGDYSIRIPPGKYTIKFSYVGFDTQSRNVELTNSHPSKEINIQLSPKALEEDEVTVSGKKIIPSISVQQLEAKDIEKMPNMYSDVLRSVQILSGVSSNNELTSGYNVRGGSFDENLIYLNGYEIYRPFLLRQGQEENQSLINPDLVGSLKFYNGAFPVYYGDKMSSALNVDYAPSDSQFKGSVRADLFNMGATLKGKSGNLNWSIGGRKAYPELFLNRLQTSGDYKPSFSDIQIYSTYDLSPEDKLELTALYADNEYDLTPTQWIGNFQAGQRGENPSQVELDYAGNRNYSYITGLAGLRYIKQFKENESLNISLARYQTEEKELTGLTSEAYYSPDAYYPDDSKEYLKSIFENNNNNINLVSYELTGEYRILLSRHQLQTGVTYKNVDVYNSIDEYYAESGPQSLQNIPDITKGSNKYDLSSLAYYINDDYKISEKVQASFGIRYLHYKYSGENLISPRGGLFYHLNAKNVFSFNWGYYYQPPFISEIFNIKDFDGTLRSQRAIHYVLGWEYQFKEHVKFQAQAYYKKLDYLIPFYYEDIKPVYYNGNTNEGYAYGLDVMFQGQIVKGIDSWLGYSYLDTGERVAGSGKPYHRRLTDQTHTIQIFLQDRIKNHPNYQSHLRLLFGSGFLYDWRKVVSDPDTGNLTLQVVTDNPQEVLIYLRADMGLSGTFDLNDNLRLLVTAEVLNVFNQYNIAGYDWMMIWNNVQGAVNIPKILSKRFFNVRFVLSF